MKLIHLSFLLGGAHMAAAQIQVSPGFTYIQTFDTLANTGASRVPWSDNGTLPGWYAYKQSTGSFANYGVSTGPESGGMASFGQNGATDRAFGTGFNLNEGDSIYFGARFANASADTIGAFSVSYDGEQWQRMSNIGGASDSLTFSYQIFDAGDGSLFTGAGWTGIDALTFTSPVSTGPGFTSLDGNLPANRVAGIYGLVTGISLEPGQELWFRWTATDLPLVNDHSLAVDNLNVDFAAVPEPAAYATVLGGLVLLGVLRRRREK